MGHLDGKVAIVTGAGGGLGRAHALLLAHEGAQVVVNDLGGDRDGTGGGTSMADGVVAEIIAAGGQAVAHYGSVSDNDAAAGMVAKAVDSFGRLDILINNAGILRDKSFKNMTDAEWDNENNVSILAVKVYVLARNIMPDTKYTNNNVYQLGDVAFDADGDNYRRLLFTSTVTLFNSRGDIWQ